MVMLRNYQFTCSRKFIRKSIASGTLADGSKVIVNADGTVSVVAQTETTQGGTVGDTTWASTNVEGQVSTYDSSNNKVVIAYIDRNNSNYGKAVVGTVSGTNIIFGSITTFNSARTQNISITFDSNNKVVIAYEDYGNSQYGTAIVGTVSGTSIIWFFCCI